MGGRPPPPSLHEKQGQCRDPACICRIEELERKTVRATIHWLPPTLKYGGLRKIVQIALDGGLFEKVPYKIDQAVVYVPKEKEDIPHYLEVTYGQESYFLLITVPGRRTECRHCSCTDHWSSGCPNTHTQKAEETDLEPCRSGGRPSQKK